MFSEVFKRSYRSLVQEILESQKDSLDYTMEDVDWFYETSLSIFENPSNLKGFYRGLALMYRYYTGGRYSLNFNQKMFTNVKQRNVEGVKKLLSSKSLNEIFEEYSFPEISKQVDDVVILLNLFLETSTLGNPCSLLECSSQLPNSVTTKNFMVNVEEEHEITNVWCMREIDLVFSVLSGGINPYTGQPFKDLESLTIKYSKEMEISKKSHSNGYRHTYIL